MLHKLQTQSLFSWTAMDRPCWGQADFFALLLTGLYLTVSRAECKMRCPPNKNTKTSDYAVAVFCTGGNLPQTLWPLMHSIWPVLCMHGATAFGAQTWSNKHLAPLKFTSSNVVTLHTIGMEIYKSGIVDFTRYTGLNLKYPDPPRCILIKNLLQWTTPFYKALRSRNLSSCLIACLMHCRLTVVLWQSSSELNLSSYLSC